MLSDAGEMMLSKMFLTMSVLGADKDADIALMRLLVPILLALLLMRKLLTGGIL